MPASEDFRQAFLALALRAGCLRLGDFTLKSGRRSPYFFDAGLFSTGAALAAVGDAYARAIAAAGLEFDVLFGPAYKGIPLATAAAGGLHRLGRDVPVAYDRKEAKTHGDAGSLFGAALRGRALIIDDVISSGRTVRQADALIRAAGATPAGLAILLDRGERGERSARSAAQEVEAEFGMPVAAVAHSRDLLALLRASPEHRAHRTAVEDYLSRYGA